MHLLLVCATGFGCCKRSKGKQRDSEACFGLCLSFLVSAAFGGEGSALRTSRVLEPCCAGAAPCLPDTSGTALLAGVYVQARRCLLHACCMRRMHAAIGNLLSVLEHI